MPNSQKQEMLYSRNSAAGPLPITIQSVNSKLESPLRIDFIRAYISFRFFFSLMNSMESQIKAFGIIFPHAKIILKKDGYLLLFHIQLYVLYRKTGIIPSAWKSISFFNVSQKFNRSKIGRYDSFSQSIVFKDTYPLDP